MDPVVEPNAQTVDPATQSGSGGEVTPFSIPDDAQVEVVVRGETVRMPWKQARGGIQMQEDYTRSKQDLAKQGKELKDLYEAVQAREKSTAEKEAALDAILGRTKPTEKKELADDEVVDGKTVRDLLAKQREEFQSTLTSTLDRTRQEDLQARQYQRWDDLTNEAINALKKEHPLLENIPQLDLVLRREAMTDKPQTEAEMKTAIVKAGQRIAKKFDDAYTERRKQEVTRKQELQTKGPALSQGVPQLAPPKKDYGQRGKINWNELEADALAAVEAFEE